MKQIMDGCTAATHVAYALSDVATIYPITPIASMGNTAQLWGMEGRKNYMGMPLEVREMESELGVAGATHGAAAAGSLAVTFTNSQGLLLMIPNMYKIAGNRLPVVFHVGSRSLATHALSIFSDHQDVMAARATGFAFLASSSVQEAMDLALVAHLAAVDGSTPVCHFFDGWRTSNEMSSIEVIDYQDMFKLINRQKVAEFHARALNPEHSEMRGTCQGPQIYFQNTEAQNPFYNNFPEIVSRKMDLVAKLTGRQYHLFDYHGAPDAEAVIVALASACTVANATADYLNSLGADANGGKGYKVGVVTVHLYRPFSAEALLAAIPATAKCVAVLDRTKEPGADGEPLYKDVATAMLSAGYERFGDRLPRVIGGRYGLSSKDFTPAMAKAVFDNALEPNSKREFTVGINDDVTHLSLDYDDTFEIPESGLKQAVFFGFGSDGTVGATKQAANIIGNAAGIYAQAYFTYSAKKSGGYTISELRLSDKPVTEEYSISRADYLACHKPAYINRFRMLDRMKKGGIFVLNSPWTEAELSIHLPASLRREIARKQAQFYIIDAQKIAQQVGLGSRINMIMETVFLKLMPVIPFAQSLPLLKEQITKTYIHEGQPVVDANLKALDMVEGALVKVEVPADWANASDLPPETEVRTTSFLSALPQGSDPLSTYLREIAAPVNQLGGDKLPVSKFPADGHMPMGTTAFEKRRIAVNVPQWNPDKCVECTLCSLVCAHAAIRPYLLTEQEAQAAPPALLTKEGKEAFEGYRYRIQVYAEDCTGCASCAIICPGHALDMTPMMPQVKVQAGLLSYCQDKIGEGRHPAPRFTIAGSQTHKPLLEFSGACGGCGETPYVKLLTQLFGERMIVANATGCSSVWGGYAPSNAYCSLPDGRGTAWGNSLFEDNAEYGYGMAVAVRTRRQMLQQAATQLVADASTNPSVKSAASTWLASFDDPDKARDAGTALVAAIKNQIDAGTVVPTQAHTIVENADLLGVPSVWAIGGDGWAYDIGFAGLDHVLASGENINIMVMDTECYSNTGGQTSKATPISAVTKYSPAGKRTLKKDLGRMMMQYGSVYVASIALGANYQQAITAMQEAEAYPGPSIIIAYCPCINHGIRAGMSHSIVEEKNAVEAGYWQLYRYNPALAAEGKDPMTVDFPSTNVAKQTQPVAELPLFLDGEDRYADLRRVAPAEVAPLRKEMASHITNTFTSLENEK